MALLLDTHAVIWWFNDDSALPSAIRASIENERSVFISAASAWEISVKFHLGKLKIDRRMIDDYDALLTNDRFISLPVSATHALRAGALPPHHRDPFDRVIIAQAMEENLTLVSVDTVFRNYGISVLWKF